MENKNKFIQLLEEKMAKKNYKYICLVLFSGGKDSTYLAHILKKATNNRVCLLNIDNGYEESSYAKKIARELNLDLYIYQTTKESLKEFYRFLLSSPELKQIDSNPLCFLCNRYFTSIGLDFAKKNDIPFVINAITPSQIFGEKIELSKSLARISNSSIREKLASSKSIVKKTEAYKKSEKLRDLLDGLFYEPDDVETIYPFFYFDYNIESIISLLEKEYNWVNPIKGVENRNYFSSGCALTKLFGICENKLKFKFHELNELEIEFKNGSINLEKYEYAVKLIRDNLRNEVTDELKDIIIELDLQDILL